MDTKPETELDATNDEQNLGYFVTRIFDDIVVGYPTAPHAKKAAELLLKRSGGETHGALNGLMAYFEKKIPEKYWGHGTTSPDRLVEVLKEARMAIVDALNDVEGKHYGG